MTRSKWLLAPALALALIAAPLTASHAAKPQPPPPSPRVVAAWTNTNTYSYVVDERTLCVSMGSVPVRLGNIFTARGSALRMPDLAPVGDARPILTGEGAAEPDGPGVVK